MDNSASLASLDLTHAQLAKELSRARDEWERNGTYVIGELPACIESFVDAFYQVPGGQDELRRRVELVASLTAEGSPYEQARVAVLRRLAPSGPHPKLFGTRMRLVYDRLRQSCVPASSVTELTHLRTCIGELIDDAEKTGEAAKRAGEAKEALERWRIACVDVIRQARLEQADGCHTLCHVHAAMGADPCELSRGIKTMLCGPLGGVLLQDIEAAAQLLKAWALDQQEADRTTQLQPLVAVIGQQVAELHDKQDAEGKGTKQADGADKQNCENKRGPTVNARMKAEMASNLEGVKGWTAQAWADHLGCGKATVIETKTWKSLSLLRQQAKAEKRRDRHRARRK